MRNAFLTACRRGQLKIVKFCIEKNLDLDFVHTSLASRFKWNVLVSILYVHVHLWSLIYVFIFSSINKFWYEVIMEGWLEKKGASRAKPYKKRW